MSRDTRECKQSLYIPHSLLDRLAEYRQHVLEESGYKPSLSKAVCRLIELGLKAEGQ